jgi:transketolase
MERAELISSLKGKALEMRKNLLRLSSIAGNLHLGGDLSMTDLMTCIFGYMLNIHPEDPSWKDRDRFILSKGHGAGPLYMSMAERGFFPVDRVFKEYGTFNTAFGVHPCCDHLPGVETSTGSLGHGLSISIGLALSARIDCKLHRVVVMLGDGELHEGSIWEGIMSAKQYKLGNLVAFVDKNNLCMDGYMKDIMCLDPLNEKFQAFGWNVLECNGHSIDDILNSIDNLPRSDSEIPSVIIGHTVKGKGISYMENNPKWHSGFVSGKALEEAIAELDSTK